MTVSAIEGQEAFDPISERDAASRPRRGIVVAVPDAADRRLQTGLGEPLGVLDRDILDAAIAVVDQPVAANGTAFVEGLLERVEHQAGRGRTGHPPAPSVQRSAGERRRR
jgi:hypothetical protein